MIHPPLQDRKDLKNCKIHLIDEGWTDFDRPFVVLDAGQIDRFTRVVRILCENTEGILTTSKLRKSDRQAFFNCRLSKFQDEGRVLDTLRRLAFKIKTGKR